MAPFLFVFFFFQAEDGIRDGHVTGVQTCALPIWIPCPCGRSGHLEGLASGPGIVRLAARLGARDQHGRTPADGHALARAAAAGDDAAAAAYRIAGLDRKSVV